MHRRDVIRLGMGSVVGLLTLAGCMNPGGGEGGDAGGEGGGEGGEGGGGEGGDDALAPPE